LSGGASFFLQEKLTDFLQELGLDVLPFIAGWTRTYGDEVTPAAETATADEASAAASTTSRKVTG
jgi:hypothetical protein